VIYLSLTVKCESIIFKGFERYAQYRLIYIYEYPRYCAEMQLSKQ